MNSGLSYCLVVYHMVFFLPITLLIICHSDFSNAKRATCKSHANNLQESYDLLKKYNQIHFLKSHVGCYCEEIRLMMRPHRNLKKEPLICQTMVATQEKSARLCERRTTIYPKS